MAIRPGGGLTREVRRAPPGGIGNNTTQEGAPGGNVVMVLRRVMNSAHYGAQG